MMGLAPYGTPKYRKLILKHLIEVRPDGTFWLDQTYFGYCAGQSMITEKFSDLFGRPARSPDRDPLEQFHMDLAASVQAITEDVMLRMGRDLYEKTRCRNLVMAGGVALNCVGNGRILREGPFEDVWIQPAAGDAGGALGVALFIWYQLLGKPRTPSARAGAPVPRSITSRNRLTI